MSKENNHPFIYRIKDLEGQGKLFYIERAFRVHFKQPVESDWDEFPGKPCFLSLYEARMRIDKELNPREHKYTYYP